MPLRHVQRGQPLKIPADDWNRIVDATRAYHERQGQSTRPATADASGGRQAGVILVRNDSGADQPRFAILGIDGPIIGPDATEGNLEEFQRQVALTGVVPTRADHGSGGAGGSGGSGARFVVLLEPLAAGAIGRACVSGVCPAQVEVGHEQDDAAIVPMPGSHSAGVWGAWFARFVSRLTGGEDPHDENYEEEHHDHVIGVERRVVHGDPAGHFQWVGPPGESEVEDSPPEIVLRHKAPGTTDWTITIEDDEQNVLGTITFDEKGHNNQSDHTITIPAGGECPDITGSASATTGSPGTNASADLTITPGPDCAFDFDFNFTIPRGEEGPKGDKGDKGDQGDDGDPADITITGDPPWINVTGSNTANVTLQHGGPGALVDEQSIITSAIATGEDANAGGATLSLTAKLLRRDQFGHVGATADDDDNNVELSVPQVLGDLADATLTSPQDEQVLTYDGGTGAWVNQDLPAVPDLEDVVGDGIWISASTASGQRKLRHIGPDASSEQSFGGFGESDKIKVDARGHITEIKGTNI